MIMEMWCHQQLLFLKIKKKRKEAEGFLFFGNTYFFILNSAQRKSFSHRVSHMKCRWVFFGFVFLTKIHLRSNQSPGASQFSGARFTTDSVSRLADITKVWPQNLKKKKRLRVKCSEPHSWSTEWSQESAGSTSDIVCDIKKDGAALDLSHN